MPEATQAPVAEASRKHGLSGDQAGLFLSATHAVEHILSASLPPLYVMIKNNLGLSYTEVGLLSTVRQTVSGLVQAPAGITVDRMGARKPLAIGFVIVSLSLLLSGWSPTFSILLLVQGLSGLGSSAFHPATYAIVSRIAGEGKVGKKMGIHTFGGFLGTTVSFALVAYLGSRFGWRQALMLLSIPGFIVSVLFWKLFDIDERPSAGPSRQTGSGTKGIAPGILALVGVTTINGMFSRGLSSFMPVFLSAAYGMSVTQAGIYSTIMTGTGCIGLLIGGTLADKYSKAAIIATSSVLMSITSLMLAGTTLTTAALTGVLVFSGLAQYTSNPSQTSLVTEFASIESQGSLFGMTFASSFLGGSVVTVVAGWMADTWGIRSIFLLLTALAASRAMMAIPLHRAVRRIVAARQSRVTAG